jgi:ribosomal protein S18 acetylase RimI-like enzyme
MAIEWTNTLAEEEWEQLSQVYKLAPLGDKPAANLKITFGNSRYRCFVHDNGSLVGAGRVLADGIDCAYICDVAILPAYQGTGLGKEIVKRLLALSRGHKKIILYAVPGKEPFYKKFGFARMKTAMAIFDDQPLAQERGYVEPPEA